MGPKPERSHSPAEWPVFANKWRCVVNQKVGENFEVGIFGSPNRIRTQDLLVNSRVFETLCLRVFSAFCDLRALTALGTGGARCQPKGPESSKSELFASANVAKFEVTLLRASVMLDSIGN